MGAALAAFAVVFVAELGDRTQLLIVSLATRHRVAPIAAGIGLGYLVTTVLSVALGSLLGAALPERPVEVGSGLLFLGFAAWTWFDRDEDDDDVAPDDDDARRGVGLALSLAGAIVLSEIGDKSMLATATLAAEQDAPVAVAAGALLGILSASVLGVVAGRLLAGRVPDDVLRGVGAALFTLFGLALLLGVRP